MVDRSSQQLTYDEVSGVCKSVLDQVIGQSGYVHTEAVKWNQRAVEMITEKLVALNRPYKICVNTIIMQTGIGAGLNVRSLGQKDR